LHSFLSFLPFNQAAGMLDMERAGVQRLRVRQQKELSAMLAVEVARRHDVEASVAKEVRGGFQSRSLLSLSIIASLAPFVMQSSPVVPSFPTLPFHY
jgi:hypothetical protein